VTLSEVKDALFQDYLQERDNRRSLSHCQCVYIVLAHCHSLTGVQLSFSGIYSFLRRSKRSIRSLSHTLISKRGAVSHRRHKKKPGIITMSSDTIALPSALMMYDQASFRYHTSELYQSPYPRNVPPLKHSQHARLAPYPVCHTHRKPCDPKSTHHLFR